MSQDKFKAAMAARQKEREQENQNYTVDYEVPEWVSMDVKKPTVFRIYGDPVHVRENAFDPKKVLVSWILNDKHGYSRFVWHDKAENPNWIMWKIYNLVMDYTYDQENKQKNYKYSSVFPEIFNRMYNNNNPKIIGEGGWKPTTSIVMNVIDRLDMQWHKENKSAKLLSAKESVDKKDTTKKFYRDGVAITMYNFILDNICEYYGNWKYYDIVGTRLPADPWYKVYHAIKDKERVLKDFPNIADKISSAEDMTEEELSWKKYDLDQIYKVSSYNKILKNLGDYIQTIDRLFQKNFYDELVDLANKEKEENAEKFANKDATSNTAIVNEKPIEQKKENPVQQKTVPEKKEAPVMRRTVKEESANTFDVNSLNKEKYKGIDKLSEEHKKLIIGVEADGSLIFTDKDENGNEIQMAEDQNGIRTPFCFTHDPYTGIAYS